MNEYNNTFSEIFNWEALLGLFKLLVSNALTIILKILLFITKLF